MSTIGHGNMGLLVVINQMWQYINYSILSGVSKVYTFITQVEVQILGFKNTLVEVSTQAFYSSKSLKVLA